jgi:hypothetical protein
MHAGLCSGQAYNQLLNQLPAAFLCVQAGTTVALAVNLAGKYEAVVLRQHAMLLRHDCYVHAHLHCKITLRCHIEWLMARVFGPVRVDSSSSLLSGANL